LNFADWDLIHYNLATERQYELVEEVALGAPEMVVFCRHPSVVTLGRATEPGDVTGWTGETAETSRGGRATYHGPGQIVIYPILDLKKRERDLHGYLRGLESAVSRALHQIGILGAEARTVLVDELSFTGVWVGDKKIASIGIAVRKWVTYHGCAINFAKDEMAFQGISPCGFQRSVMTSVEEILGETNANLRDALKSSLMEQFRLQFDLLDQTEVDSPALIDHAY
jgi:lipoyl(octanoyl) transferase